MNRRRMWAVVTKEWADVFRNRMVLLLVGLPPALMLVLSQGALFATGRFPPGDLDDLRPFLDRPEYAGLSELGAGQVLTGQYFLTLFLLMPLIIPVSIAAYSIVGEKVQRSLEALLATPIGTGELLLGKCLAAVGPAVAVTWGSFAVFVVGARLMAVDDLTFQRLVSPVWIAVIMVVAPLVATLGVALSVTVSSKVNDPRAVEQSIGMLVIPVLGLFVAQMSGLLTLNFTTLAVGVAVVALLDVLALRTAVRTFDREAILTRWK